MLAKKVKFPNATRTLYHLKKKNSSDKQTNGHHDL